MVDGTEEMAGSVGKTADFNWLCDPEANMRILRGYSSPDKTSNGTLVGRALKKLDVGKLSGPDWETDYISEDGSSQLTRTGRKRKKGWWREGGNDAYKTLMRLGFSVSTPPPDGIIEKGSYMGFNLKVEGKSSERVREAIAGAGKYLDFGVRSSDI